MSEVSRRRALLTAATGIAMLAGCADSSERSTFNSPRRRRSVDYELEAVRNEAGDPPVTRADAESQRADDERSAGPRNTRRVLTSRADLDDLAFSDGPDGERLRAFTAETDYDAASVYLLVMDVGACYEIRLESVTVERDELAADDIHPHADFCERYRPADVECDADETHSAGFAIRIPIAAARSTGSGFGMGGSCRPSPHDEIFNGSVTPPSGGDDG